MGFGILFIGYFFTYVGAITPFSEFTYVFGAGVIIYSLKNLIYENKFFGTAMIASIFLEAVSVAKMILSVFGYINTVSYTVTENIQSYLASITAILLVIAIYCISKQVGLFKVQAKSIVDLILFGIYIFGEIVCNVVNNDFIKQRLLIVSLMAFYICTLFTLVIIFNCYVRICYEGDENMDSEPNNKFLAYLNRILDKVMSKNNKTGKKK